jgi:predicted nucleotidyltransferase component of viral defense system
MKDYLASQVKQAATPLEGRNLVREYLQARILESLQRSGAMIPLTFHGGTALRFLFSYGRYSEDLDFALVGNRKAYDLQAFIQSIRSDFAREGYRLETKMNIQRTVNSAWIRFPGLLFEMNLSTMENEVMAVKIEVDTSPPEGSHSTTTVVRRFVILQLHHHDKASLFAGKLHAVLQRPYPKGRDLYDLLWYLSDPAWDPPNLVFLNNALTQTNWKGERLTEGNWKMIVLSRLESLNWRMVIEDVRPFVEPGFNLDLLSLANMRGLLES